MTYVKDSQQICQRSSNIKAVNIFWFNYCSLDRGFFQDCFVSNFINGRRLLLIDASSMPRIGITDFEHIKVKLINHNCLLLSYHNLKIKGCAKILKKKKHFTVTVYARVSEIIFSAKKTLSLLTIKSSRQTLNQTRQNDWHKSNGIPFLTSLTATRNVSARIFLPTKLGCLIFGQCNGIVLWQW